MFKLIPLVDYFLIIGIFLQVVAGYTNVVDIPEGTEIISSCRAISVNPFCDGDFDQEQASRNIPLASLSVENVKWVGDELYEITIRFHLDVEMDFSGLNKLSVHGLLTPDDYLDEKILYEYDASINLIDDPADWTLTYVLRTLSMGDKVCLQTFEIQFAWCLWPLNSQEFCSTWPYLTEYEYMDGCPANNRDGPQYCWPKECDEG